MRSYEKSHPWISFRADFRKVPWEVWVALGECQANCQHLAGVPLRPTTAEQLHRLYLVKGVRATTAIEGNTLSEDQVQALLDHTLALPASQEYLKVEVENVVDVCNRLLETVQAGEGLSLEPETIKRFNYEILNGLPLADDVVPGEFREHSVGVARYRGAPAEDCEYLVDRVCRWLEGGELDAPAGMTIVFAIIKAVLAHLYLAWIHPFGDGNGRTARLVEFQVLIASGVPAPAAHLLSNHYNQTRAEYYRQLERASASSGDVIPFLEYAVQGLREGLREQIEVVRNQQSEITWDNYIYERFRDRGSPSNRRRRLLILHLSYVNRHEKRPIPLSELPHLSAAVAIEYARRTPKTLSRDVNTLIDMGLLVKTDRGYRARTEIMSAFMPALVPDGTAT